MTRKLLPSAAFLRVARHALKRDSSQAIRLQRALMLLASDAFDPRLRSHKLKGALEGSWACSAGYDLRILFRFVEQDGEEAVLLETIGSHDEVY